MIFAILIPAAPAPAITTLHWLGYLSQIRRELISPARDAIDVPCWSSWKTAKLLISWRPLSIVKHSGALISYRFIALYKWIKSNIALIAYCGLFRAFMQTGTTLTFPNSLKIIDLASITGSPGTGPMFPNPKIEVPSVNITLSFEHIHSWLRFSDTNLIKFYSVKHYFN